jgi:hypothetical protein
MLLLILELLDAKFSRFFVSIRIIILLQVLLQEVAKAHDDQELTLGTNYTVFLFQLSRFSCSKLQHIDPKPFQMLLLILELLDAKFSRSLVSIHIIILLQVLLQEVVKANDDQELTLGTN